MTWTGVPRSPSESAIAPDVSTRLGQHGLRDGDDEQAQGKLEDAVGVVQHRDGPLLEEGAQHPADHGVDLVQG